MNSDKNDKILKFPEGFLWGAATSHFQVEGHPKEIGGSLSDWSQWTKVEGKIFDKSHADDACQFYHRFEEDLSLIKDLNLSAFRISLNWPALVKEDGSLDEGEVDYYKRVLTGLKENGIKTFVTLFHFCLPDKLSMSGGWQNEETAVSFGKFSGIVAKRLEGLVDYWLTINEPLAYVYQGFISGHWPPGGNRDYVAAFTALRNFLVGHSLSYDAIKEHSNKPVSYTLHWRPFYPKNRFSPLDHMVRYYRDQIFNHLFPRSVESGILKFPWPVSSGVIKSIEGEIKGLKGKCDYLAINYYTRELSRFKPAWPLDLFGESSPENELAVSDMGWEIYPEGLYDLLVRQTLPYQTTPSGAKRPVVITENGFANMYPPELSEGDWSLKDEQRVNYLIRHLEQLYRAIRGGVDVRGYLYWSLLDNFEWAEGLSARFGLVRVSYPTQERLLRASARVYQEIARNNAIQL
jgi:beta-glucosidase